MEQFHLKNIVFSSSATVYGDPDVLPVTESTAFKKALSSYGSTKQMGEEILEKTTAAKNIAAISLRYFNPVGAHSSALIGELPIGVPNNLMPFIAQTAAGIREKLVVFGDDYDTPDGTCIRDYIHIADLVSAHLLAMDGLRERDRLIYNLGSGNGYSVREVIETARQVTGHPIPANELPRRPGDSARLVASSDKIKRDLGWTPEHDNLSEIISSAWEWHQSHPNGYED